MDTFALRAARTSSSTAPSSSRRASQTIPAGNPSSRTSSSIPHLDAYRSYAANPQNAGTFVSTSAAQVTTAPDTFYGHTISFITGKTNTQEAVTLHQSIEQQLGPHVANYAFPAGEREQAGTSNFGGIVQKGINTALTTAFNPTLQNIGFDVSLANPENVSPALPFLQRQLRPVVQSAVQELNPALRGMKLDISFSTTVSSVGVSHQLVQQVIQKADALVADTVYIKEAATAVTAIVNQLDYLDEGFVIARQQQEISGLQNTISGLAKDLTTHHSNSSQATATISSPLSTSLKKAAIDIPKTIQTAHSLLSETKALASALQNLKQQHNYDELGSSAPINLEAYDFEQFIQPVKELLQEEASLAVNVTRHLCSPPTSTDKEVLLETYLSQNDRVSRDLEKYSQQIAQLKKTLKKELNNLSTKAAKQRDLANQAMSAGSIWTFFRTRILGYSPKEEQEQAQENLDFATATLALIHDAEQEGLSPGL